MTTILLITLLAGSWFPTNSYEMGHYAPMFIAGGVGNYTMQLAYDMFWYEADPINRDFICLCIGVGTTVVAGYLLRNHYQTDNEQSWGQLGRGHFLLGQMTINLLRIPIHNRNKRKAVATVESWGLEETK